MNSSNDSRIYYDYSVMTEKQEIIKTALNSVFGWVRLLVALLAVWLVFNSFVVTTVKVDGNSMQPTFNSGDRLIVYSLGYQPRQGDIVLVGTTEEYGMPLIKRVIATENQVVDINYKTGEVTVDGKVIFEPYISSMKIPPVNEISYPYTVPQGHLFLLGDNRDESRDSRYKAVQSIDENRVVGKVILRFYPFDDFSLI